MIVIPYNEGMIAGFISGITTTTLSYPLDTVKTFHQDRKNKNAFPKNVFEYYRGIKYPLIQNSFLTSFMFFQYETMKKKHSDNLLLCNVYMGMYDSFISCPIDKFKISQQQKLFYPLTLQNFVYSYKDIGIVALRKIPATFLYFSTYQKLEQYNLPSFISGGIAGIVNWGITYPIDTIKTRIQNGSCDTIPEAFQKGNLWNGVTTAMFRAFFVCGLHFFSYETCLSVLRNESSKN